MSEEKEQIPETQPVEEPVSALDNSVEGQAPAADGVAEAAV